MKKDFKFRLLLLGLGGCLLLSPVASLAANDVPDMSQFSDVSGIVKDKCLACHSKDYDLPFYAKLPGIKGMIEKDYRDGLRAMDLNTDLIKSAKGEPVSEATLAKMEWVVQNNTMPPAKFTIVHWDSKLTNDENKQILDWVATTRAAHYATCPAEKHANEPIQPIPLKIKTDPAKVALGEVLFNDKRLSDDNTLACSGCHAEDKAGTDSLQFSEGIRKQIGNINAPTTYNAVFNLSQFWDGRAANLKEQAEGPPMNPIEMGSKKWEDIMAKLAADEELTAAFTEVYPDGWNKTNLVAAIAEYEKTLITPNSRFDLWLKGDDNAISQDELAGYQRFKAYRCANCHVGKGLGGRSYEFMDLKDNYFEHRGNPLGSDVGLMGLTKNEDDKHKFKVPNLRNIEMTAPYLHDGTVQTLDKAVEIMGSYLSGMPVPPADRDLIVAFLRTLTGELNGEPVKGVVAAK